MMESWIGLSIYCFIQKKCSTCVKQIEFKPVNPKAMENKRIISKNIRDLRRKSGYTQAFVAEYLNITAAAVSQYENDAQTIPTQVIEKLALLYNVEEYDLYEENPEKQELLSAFAFLPGDISAADMQHICQFKKIVNNYINMSIALEHEQG